MIMEMELDKIQEAIREMKGVKNRIYTTTEKIENRELLIKKLEELEKEIEKIKEVI